MDAAVELPPRSISHPAGAPFFLAAGAPLFLAAGRPFFLATGAPFFLATGAPPLSWPAPLPRRRGPSSSFLAGAAPSSFLSDAAPFSSSFLAGAAPSSFFLAGAPSAAVPLCSAPQRPTPLHRAPLPHVLLHSPYFAQLRRRGSGIWREKEQWREDVDGQFSILHKHIQT